MKKYDYLSPTTIDEALSVLEDTKEDTHIIAGGTDLVVNIRSGWVKPKRIVNINKIDELKYVKEEDGLIKIGALMSFSQLERNDLLNKKAKALVSACSEVGSVQIRNLGTVGGNIVNASPAADSVAALMVYDASLLIRSKRGERVVKLVDFYENGRPKIEKDELLCEVFFQKPNDKTATAFTKLGRRKALAIVVLSMGALIEKDDSNKCLDARFVLGGVSRNPIRLYDIEKSIIGRELNRENLYGLIADMSPFIYKTIVEGSPGSARRLRSAKYKSKSIKGVGKTTFNAILSDLGIEE